MATFFDLRRLYGAVLALPLTIGRLIVVILGVITTSGIGHADDLSLQMRRFSQEDGIDSSYIFRMSQDRLGYLYVSTRRSTYFYSGKRFYPIRALNFAGAASLVAIVRPMPDGRVLVIQGQNIYLSISATSARISPNVLVFQHLFVKGLQQIRNIFVDNEDIFVLDSSGLHSCVLNPRYNLGCNPTPLFAHRRENVYQNGYRTYVALHGEASLRDLSGRIIFRAPFGMQHPQPSPGPSDQVPYFTDGKTLISLNDVGRFSATPLNWPIEFPLGGARATFAEGWGDTKIFFDGDSLRSFNGAFWSYLNHDLSREQDILFAFIDRNRQVWTAQDLVELDKLVGWGDLENLEPQHIRYVWSVLPFSGYQLLFSGQGMYPVDKHVIGSALRGGNYYFALKDSGHSFWAPVDDQLLLHCEVERTSSHCDRQIALDRVVALALSRRSHLLWIASDAGIYSLGEAVEAQPKPIHGRDGKTVSQMARTLALRADDTPWAVIGTSLYRRDADGAWVSVLTEWPNAKDFIPMAMTFSSRDDLWIGGIRAKNGLMHLVLDGNRISRIEQIGADRVGSELIFSLLWDKRHRLWVGTENGLAVYNGLEWIRMTRDDGLLSSNINQQGLSEDEDGSIWVATSRGVSHLLHPERLFERQTLDPVFIRVALGDHLLPEKAVPFSRDPLMVTLGTLNTALANTTYFRYRLEGVDQNWITTTTGEIRYNFVPPGHSRLVVQALNDNRNLISPPITLEIRMQRPWWTTWPLIMLYTMSVVALPYAFTHLRFRYLLKRQHRLEALVNERTIEMRAAQHALEQQARQDGLTRLMNRRTAEASVSRLLERLSRLDVRSSTRFATLALLDVDHFKSINDTFGHVIGDEILAGIGARLLRAKYQEEIIGRYGGEEFLIVIQGDFVAARARIATLLGTLSDVPFETKIGTLSVGCSAGIARMSPEEAWSDALERADQALYKAKIAGRGRIVVSERDLDDEGYPD